MINEWCDKQSFIEKIIFFLKFSSNNMSKRIQILSYEKIQLRKKRLIMKLWWGWINFQYYWLSFRNVASKRSKSMKAKHRNNSQIEQSYQKNLIQQKKKIKISKAERNFTFRENQYFGKEWNINYKLFVCKLTI